MAEKRRRTPKDHVPGEVARQPDSARAIRPAPPVEYSRNFAPRGIAALLAPVLRPAFRRRAPAAAQLLADWPALAGPALAARAAPVKFAAGTLTLACSGPAAMELQLSAPALIQRLNLGLGAKTVERLRFIRQTTDFKAFTPPTVQTAPLPAPPPDDLPEGALGEALARLYQGLKTRG